jgi:flagellar hook protein FlgE
VGGTVAIAFPTFLKSTYPSNDAAEPRMSLFSALTTSVSGMAAQAFKLSTISDNIANVNTTGYKQAATQFETLVQGYDNANYNSAGVGSRVRYNISEQGEISAASSTTDLAVQGNGFFIVEDSSGATLLTRAGSFRKDEKGNLVNAAGYTLMGYSTKSGSTSADGLAGLTPVNVSIDDLTATPSTTATLSANLDSAAAVATGNLPSTNTTPVTYTSKSSLVAYDDLGTAKTLDLYFTKTATNTWELAIYDSDDATSGTFPYTSAALAVDTLNFSATDGSLTGTGSLSVNVPGGEAMTIDLSAITQVAAPFAVNTATTNGNAPSTLESLSVKTDGTLSGVYANGQEKSIYTIPLASVPSVDNLTVVPGNVFRAGTKSGDILVGTAKLGGLGSIQSSSLESSTVDLASQLTDMIVAQRGYEANTKVFQTGSELLGLLTTMLK